MRPEFVYRESAGLLRAAAKHFSLCPDDIVLISGSVLEGWGTKSSDIDMYVLSGQHKKMSQLTFMYNEVPVDIEIWPLNAITKLGKSVVRGSRDLRIASSIRQDQLQLAHRVQSGLVLQNRAKFLQLSNQFSVASVSMAFLNRILDSVPGILEDVAGLSDEGYTDSACLSARRLLGVAVDAICSAYGETNPSEKWRLLKFEKAYRKGCLANLPNFLSEPQMYDLVRRNLIQGPKQGREHSFMLCAVAAANALLAASQRRACGDEAKTGVDLPAKESQFLPLGASIGRAPNLCLDVRVEYDQGSFLVSRLRNETRFRFNRSAVAVILGFDGRPIDEIARPLSKESLLGIEQSRILVLSIAAVLEHSGFTTAVGPSPIEARL